MVLSCDKVTARVHPIHLTNVWQRKAAADPQTKPTHLSCESACRLQALHPPSPFIITQPESWYSFYRPTEGGRLSQHRHTTCSPTCIIILHRTTLHMGVRNLPKVFTGQRPSRESNSSIYFCSLSILMGLAVWKKLDDEVWADKTQT